MNNKEKLWDRQAQIKDIRRQIEYNNEHNNRLMKKWEEHYNGMTNYMVGIEPHWLLSQLDLSAIIEIIKNNKPC